MFVVSVGMQRFVWGLVSQMGCFVSRPMNNRCSLQSGVMVDCQATISGLGMLTTGGFSGGLSGQTLLNHEPL